MFGIYHGLAVGFSFADFRLILPPHMKRRDVFHN